VENTLISAYWKGGSVTEDANIYSGAYTGLASGKLGSFTVECKVTL
jgi:hypothetical protein